MTPVKPRELVARAQRRTATRADAHLLLSKMIENLGLERAEETDLRNAAYLLLYPEAAMLTHAPKG